MQHYLLVLFSFRKENPLQGVALLEVVQLLILCSHVAATHFSWQLSLSCVTCLCSITMENKGSHGRNAPGGSYERLAPACYHKAPVGHSGET